MDRGKEGGQLWLRDRTRLRRVQAACLGWRMAQSTAAVRGSLSEEEEEEQLAQGQQSTSKAECRASVMQCWSSYEADAAASLCSRSRPGATEPHSSCEHLPHQHEHGPHRHWNLLIVSQAPGAILPTNLPLPSYG